MLSLARRRLFTSGLPLARLSSTLPQSPAQDLSDGEKTIHEKLTTKFAPSLLQVQDVSGGCGSFYAITIASQAFAGLSVIKQHRLVTQTLKDEIEGIHGLQIKTMSETP